MVDLAVLLAALAVDEVELNGNGGDDKLEGVGNPPELSPELYGEVPVGMMEECECVLDFDLLCEGVV
jgi:hypothetical protein